MSLLKTRGLTPGVTNSLHNSQKNLIEMTLNSKLSWTSASRNLGSKRAEEREKEREDEADFRRHHLFSALIPSLCQVGQQVDSNAWERGRHHCPSPCLTHARDSLSAGLRKLGTRPLVNRCHNGQPENASIQPHEPKPLLYPQLPLRSTLAGKLPL